MLVINIYSLMSKFNSFNRHTCSTAHTNTLTPRHRKDQHITPFPMGNMTDRSLSPAHQKIANSPLNIPLVIALNKLTVRQPSTCYPVQWDQYATISQIQSVKNILQQFCESLYSSLERDIYCKFNAEMKRMVLKYRQTERLLKKIEQKIVMNADILQIEQRSRQQSKKYKITISILEDQITKVTNELHRQIMQKEMMHRQINRLQRENSKIIASLERYQNLLLKKFQQQTHYDNRNIQNSQKDSSHSYADIKPSIEETNRISLKSNQSQCPYYVDIPSTLTNSYILNLNKLQPSHSPLKIRKIPQNGLAHRNGKNQSFHMRAFN